jgi:hypothetical protein
MYYIIVRDTGMIHSDGPHPTRAYKTFGAARATRTRLCRKQGWGVDQLSIVDTKLYKPKMVERTNIMTGKKFTLNTMVKSCSSIMTAPKPTTLWPWAT